MQLTQELSQKKKKMSNISKKLYSISTKFLMLTLSSILKTNKTSNKKEREKVNIKFWT